MEPLKAVRLEATAVSYCKAFRPVRPDTRLRRPEEIQTLFAIRMPPELKQKAKARPVEKLKAKPRALRAVSHPLQRPEPQMAAAKQEANRSRAAAEWPLSEQSAAEVLLLNRARPLRKSANES